MHILSKRILVLVSFLMWVSVCYAQQVCAPNHVTIQKLVDVDLRYQLVEGFGPVRFCDPYCFGPCHFVRARKDAEAAFTTIKQDEKTFHLILKHLGLQKITEASPEQKWDIFGEYVKLVCGVIIEPQGEDHAFTIKTADGFRIEGLIKKNGDIVVVEKELTALICPK